MNITFTNAKKPTINIPNKSLKEFIQMLEEYYKVVVTKKDVLQMVKLRTDVAMMLVDHSFWDTDERGVAGGALVEYITDEEFWWWPVNGDTESHKEKFFKSFIKGCAKKNIPHRYRV